MMRKHAFKSLFRRAVQRSLTQSAEPTTQWRNVNGYLAGPDVFYPDAFVERGTTKKSICEHHGIIPYFPLDNEVTPPLEASLEHKRDFGYRIGKANEDMMLRCLKHSDDRAVIFANMRPWHGPSLDVGTSFEVGFMSALAAMYPERILIIGYTNDVRSFHDRILEEYYKHRFTECKNLTYANGAAQGPDGNHVEHFGFNENLMLEHAVQKSGGRIFQHRDELEAFRLAAAYAYRHFAGTG